MSATTGRQHGSAATDSKPRRAPACPDWRRRAAIGPLLIGSVAVLGAVAVLCTPTARIDFRPDGGARPTTASPSAAHRYDTGPRALLGVATAAGGDVAQRSVDAPRSAQDVPGPVISEATVDLPDGIGVDAYGANVDILNTCVACTTAQAGPNSAGGEGRALRLAGETVIEGQTPVNGYGYDTLVAVPDNPLVRMALLTWNGSSTANRREAQSHARSALLDLALGDGGPAAVSVGESRSDAAWSRSGSHASGETSAARARLLSGELTVVVLHSEGSSRGPGRVQVLCVNGVVVTPSTGAAEGAAPTDRVARVTLLRDDRAGGVLAKVDDGRAQRVVSLGTTWVGRPAADPQPLR
jgi:hypothetical protein